MTDEGTDFAYDFFVSRRGTVGEIAAEVARVLEGVHFRVVVQDHDFGRGGNFVADIHGALTKARHLIVLHTADYDQNHWTLQELANFLAALPGSGGGRRLCVLRCDDSVPRGLLAGVVYGDLVGVTDPEERAGIILATARGEPLRARHQPPVFGGTMPARNGNFTGRAALLEAVHASLATALDEPKALTQTAVRGLGGVGKTSLAREYVHRFGPDYAGVWWMAAETREGLIAGLAALAARLDPKLAEAPELEKAARAALARVERSERPFLLVYDNVPSPGVLEGLVPTRGARVLLTTRWADWGGRAREVLVEALAEDETVEFLQARAGRHDPAGARRLALDLGCLPLALDHAGAYVKLASVSFGAYAERVEELIAKAPKDALYPASVAATFDLAIASAVQECAAAERLLGFFAFLAPERIPLALVDRMVLPEDERGEALMALTAVSLVRRDPVAADNEVPSVSVHRLVQAVTRTRLVTRDAADAMLETVVSRLAEAFPAGAYADVRVWPECERLLPHVLALREQAQRRDHSSSAFSPLLGRTALFLHGRGSLRERAQRRGHASSAFSKLLDRAASFLHRRGSLHEAEPLFREAVAAGERVLGREHPDVLKWRSNLDYLLDETARVAEAKPRWRSRVAELLRETGLDAGVEPLVRETVETGERVLGREHPDIMIWRNNLALLLRETGRLAEAEPLFREVVAAGERVLGREHPNVLAWRNNLANLLRDTGRHAGAPPEASE